MAKIKQLSPLEAQKIAAGEVVERPANVVKELIENALDAGASVISLYLEEGGKKLIRVTDNGSGMSPEDARLAILHHATSKITTVEDLNTISTFGFRGEALSSIASVSRVVLTTKEESDSAGIALTIVEGTIKKEEIVSTNTGTEIAVHDLFFNVPARRKFLKTKETELRAIAHLFQAISLTYHHVSFKFYHDERLVYNVPAVNTLSERLVRLFEPNLAKNSLLINANHDRMNLSLTGAVTESSFVRYDRNYIFVFVNNRWVKNHKLTQALIKGYQGMLPTQRYPAGFLFITIDPLYVDINIHPRKEEVQFLHPRIVEDLIQTTVQKRLEDKHSQQIGTPQTKTETIKEPARLLKEPIYTLFTHTDANSTTKPDENQKHQFLQFLDKHFKKEKSGQEHNLTGQSLTELSAVATSATDQEPAEPLISAYSSIEQFVTKSLHEQQTTEHSIEKNEVSSSAQSIDEQSQQILSLDSTQFNYRLLGQLHLTYIMIETSESLVFIDQHAAHERVVYEQLRTRFDETARIRCLFPQIISVTQDDATIFEPYLELLLQFGIDAQRISDHEIIIQETPIFLKNQSLEDAIKQAIGVLHEYQYLEKSELQKIMHERIHAHLSCKAAVKAGDELSTESMHELIKKLYATDNKLTCPHGRPTIWELKNSDIQKKFKRDYR